MKKATKEFTVFIMNVCASLVASFVYSYITYFTQPGSTANIKDWFINTVITYKFIIIWVIVLFLIMIIRYTVRKWIDKLQAPYPMVYGFSYSYDITNHNVQGYGFQWRVSANVEKQDPYTDEILSIRVGRVDGAYCKNDFREMKVTRTYFGRYKYKCPKCGYKRILLKSNHTLQCELEDEIEATYRQKQNLKRQA